MIFWCLLMFNIFTSRDLWKSFSLRIVKSRFSNQIFEVQELHVDELQIEIPNSKVIKYYKWKELKVNILVNNIDQYWPIILTNNID